jgi:hypothetical protein
MQLVVEYMPSMHEALGLIHSMAKQNKTRYRTTGDSQNWRSPSLCRTAYIRMASLLILIHISSFSKKKNTSFLRLPPLESKTLLDICSHQPVYFTKSREKSKPK